MIGVQAYSEGTGDGLAREEYACEGDKEGSRFPA